MKTASFGDRARQLAAWFQDWSHCEQTIVLYSLLSKVSATQAHFLCLVLEHRLKNSADSKELIKMETESNNPGELLNVYTMLSLVSGILVCINRLCYASVYMYVQYIMFMHHCFFIGLE